MCTSSVNRRLNFGEEELSSGSPFGLAEGEEESEENEEENKKTGDLYFGEEPNRIAMNYSSRHAPSGLQDLDSVTLFVVAETLLEDFLEKESPEDV